MHAPDCETKELTRIMWLHKSGEPPEHPDHQIVYDQDVIEICPSCNGATIERLRHDCFDFEAVYNQYEWYELGPDDGVRLRTIASGCQRPLDPFCRCASHKSLRESALALPSSSWDAIFESSAHRHMVTVSDGPKPTLILVPTSVAVPTTPEKPKTPDAETVGFVFLAWPALYAITLAVWFRLVSLPWYLDTLVALIALPVTFVVAGVVLAAGRVIYDNYNK